MTQQIIISKQKVRDYDLTNLASWNGYSPEYAAWTEPAGRSEFRLYAYLSEKVNYTTILEVGTRHGGSTVALSANPSNDVITYDIIHWDTHDMLDKINIQAHIGNFMEDNIDYTDISIVMIDVDPHDGLQEPPMLQFLLDQEWSGLLLLDDIGPLWPAIQAWWDSLPYEKYDLTDIGHYSGTGLVNIGNKFTISVVE